VTNHYATADARRKAPIYGATAGLFRGRNLSGSSTWSFPKHCMENANGDYESPSL
jgi:hypothetical protein